MDNRHRSTPRCPFHHKEAVHVPGIAAVRTGPGRPTGIGVPTFSAGWEGEGVVGAKAPEQYTTVCSLSQTCTPPHTPHAHPHTPHMHTPTHPTCTPPQHTHNKSIDLPLGHRGQQSPFGVKGAPFLHLRTGQRVRCRGRGHNSLTAQLVHCPQAALP